jgi:hypothetical protein
MQNDASERTSDQTPNDVSECQTGTMRNDVSECFSDATPSDVSEVLAQQNDASERYHHAIPWKYERVPNQCYADVWSIRECD